MYKNNCLLLLLISITLGIYANGESELNDLTNEIEGLTKINLEGDPKHIRFSKDSHDLFYTVFRESIFGDNFDLKNYDFNTHQESSIIDLSKFTSERNGNLVVIDKKILVYFYSELTNKRERFGRALKIDTNLTENNVKSLGCKLFPLTTMTLNPSHKLSLSAYQYDAPSIRSRNH